MLGSFSDYREFDSPGLDFLTSSPWHEILIPPDSAFRSPSSYDPGSRSQVNSLSLSLGSAPYHTNAPTLSSYDQVEEQESLHYPPMCFEHISFLLGELFSEELFGEELALPCKICAITSGCSAYHHTVSFRVDWDLIGFLQSEYGNLTTRVKDVITISGGALSAYATPCSEYLKESWPRSGGSLLDKLQFAVDCYRTGDDSAIPPTDDNLRVHISPRTVAGDRSAAGNTHITAHGDFQELNDLAQQLCWLGAAMRTHCEGDRPAYCEALFQPSALKSGVVFDISFIIRELSPPEALCWFPLFRNAVIAHPFAVPHRERVIGLEIPIAMLAALGDIRHAVEYGGGVVLKGFSTMFIPVKLFSDSVQWHFVKCQQAAHLTYEVALKACNKRVMTNELDLETFPKMRAIVGWCTEATIIAGSETFNYDGIGISGAGASKQYVRVIGGSLGFSQWGAFQVQFAIGNKEAVSAGRDERQTLRSVLTKAQETPVVLYDLPVARGYLIPAIEVILLVVQHRIHRHQSKSGGNRANFLWTDKKRRCTRHILLDKIELQDDSLENTIQDIWSTIEILQASKFKAESSSGFSWHVPFQERVDGFELSEIVRRETCFEYKSAVIHKSGGWVSLVQDLKALVLFTDGLGDAIIPTGDPSGLCHKYGSLPKQAHYLATTVEMLRTFFDNSKSSEVPSRLTAPATGAGLQLDREGQLFEPCLASTPSRPCQCLRIHMIKAANKAPRVVRLDDLALVPKGAIIFGHRRKRPRYGFALELSDKTLHHQSSRHIPIEKPKVAFPRFADMHSSAVLGAATLVNGSSCHTRVAHQRRSFPGPAVSGNRESQNGVVGPPFEHANDRPTLRPAEGASHDRSSRDTPASPTIGAASFVHCSGVRNPPLSVREGKKKVVSSVTACDPPVLPHSAYLPSRPVEPTPNTPRLRRQKRFYLTYSKELSDS